MWLRVYSLLPSWLVFQQWKLSESLTGLSFSLPILTCCRTNIWAHFLDDCDNFSLQLRGISSNIIKRREKKGNGVKDKVMKIILHKTYLCSCIWCIISLWKTISPWDKLLLFTHKSCILKGNKSFSSSSVKLELSQILCYDGDLSQMHMCPCLDKNCCSLVHLRRIRDFYGC